MRLRHGQPLIGSGSPGEAQSVAPSRLRMTARPNRQCSYRSTPGSYYKSLGYSSCVRDARPFTHNLPSSFTASRYTSGKQERVANNNSHLPLSSQIAVIVVLVLIHIEETSRSRGVISQESPEPGYIVVSFTVLVLNPIPAPSTFSPSRLPLSFAIPMAFAVTYRRQLVPTGGQTEASTRVQIRTRSSSASGGSHAFGLIFRRGAIDYVVDYTGRFAVGTPLPPGVSLQIGSQRLFISSFPEA